MSLDFIIDLILPATQGPEADLAYNKNEYQGGRHLELTTSLPSVNQLSREMWESLHLRMLWASTSCLFFTNVFKYFVPETVLML